MLVIIQATGKMEQIDLINSMLSQTFNLLKHISMKNNKVQGKSYARRC